MKKRLVTVLLTAAIALSAAACGNSDASGASAKETGSSAEAETVVEKNSDDTKETSSGEVRTIYIGTASSNYPLAYTDDDGNWTGYEVEVMRKVDEALPQYEFEFVDASAQDSAYTGLSTGKYQIALSNAFYTEERAENYNIPENQLGASPCGLIQRKENADIKTLAQAASAGQKISPLAAGDGLTYQIIKYNNENPDNQIDFEYSDGSSQWTDCIVWVAEGRYDYAIFPKTYYEQLVVTEDGALHEYNDLLSYEAVIPVETYAIIAKEETQLCDDVDVVLGQLKEDGTLVEIALEFFGFDPFATNTEVSE